MGVPEKERDVKYAEFRNDVGERRIGDQCDIDLAALDGLDHLDLAAEFAVRKLLDAKLVAGPFLDLFGEGLCAGAELRVLRQEISDSENLLCLGANRRNQEQRRHHQYTTEAAGHSQISFQRGPQRKADSPRKDGQLVSGIGS